MKTLPQVGLLRRVVERIQVNAVLGVVLVGVARPPEVVRRAAVEESMHLRRVEELKVRIEGLEAVVLRVPGGAVEDSIWYGAGWSRWRAAW